MYFRAWLFTLLLPVLCAGFLGAQTDKPNEPARFTSTTEVVLVPTIVTDKSGAHVSGLNKEDFVLDEDGKPRPIAVFEEIRTDSQRLRRSAGENGQFTNFDPTGEGHHRLSIIVLDLLNTPIADQFTGRMALIKFLEQVADTGEPLCIVALSRSSIIVIHDFTDDPRVLAEAMRKLASNNAPRVHQDQVTQIQPPGSDPIGSELRKLDQALLESDRQLASLERKTTALTTVEGLSLVAKAFGRLPGRKSLIWVSSGFPYSLSSPSMLLCEPACPAHQRYEVQGSYDKLWRALNDAQISIYSVDLRALTVGNFNASQSSDDFTRPAQMVIRGLNPATEARWQSDDTTSTLRLFAENTGGKAFLNSNDLIQSFREAVDDDSHYYVLGYYVDRSRTTPGWHALNVSVRQKGVRTRCRKGFYLRASDAAPREDIRIALISPLDFTGIPLTVSWSRAAPATEAGKKQVQFELVIPSRSAWVDESNDNHLLVDFAAVVRNNKGQIVAQASRRLDQHLPLQALHQIQESGVTFRAALQLAPGQYTVRFAVLDSLGDRMGSVAAPINIAP